MIPLNQAHLSDVLNLCRQTQELVDSFPGEQGQKQILVAEQAVSLWDKWRATLDGPPMLAGAKLGGCQLTGADLRQADLANADLTDTQGFQVRLDGANLRNAVAKSAHWSWAHLRDVCCENADFSGASLTLLILSGNWTRTKLVSATIKGISVAESTSFTDAEFTGCQMLFRPGDARTFRMMESLLSPGQRSKISIEVEELRKWWQFWKPEIMKRQGSFRS
jgi:uncharacterized protein YjbI with pentapeptide repeats